MLRTWSLPVVGALVIGAVACSGPLEEEGASAPSAASRAQPNDDIPTVIESGGVEILQAYNGILDRLGPACVTAGSVKTNAGAISQQSSLTVIESREELKREIGIDVNLALKAPTANVKASLEILNSFQRTSNSITLVYKIASSYRVDAVGPQVALTSSALEALQATDPDRFIAKCGSGWVTGVKFEARALVVMQVTADTAEHLLNAKAALSGGANLKVAEGTAEATGKIADVLKSNNATTSTQVLLTGFASNASPMGSDLDKTLAALPALETDLHAAVSEAHAADATKTGANRGVVPVSFSIRSYLDAADAPVESLRAVQDKLQLAEAWFSDNARFRAVLDDVYYGEILAYAPDAKGAAGTSRDDFPRRAGFNLRRLDGDDRALPTQVRELDAIAERFKKQFDPDARVDITARKRLDSAIEACVNEELANQRYPEECLLINKEPAFAEAVAALKVYEKEGRILPLAHRFVKADNWVSPDDQLASSDAPAACQALGKGWRQATFDDLAVLAPVLTTHDPPTAWIADPTRAGCASGMEGWLSNPNGNVKALKQSVVCQARAGVFAQTQPVLCVNGDGPHGAVTPLDLHYSSFANSR